MKYKRSIYNIIANEGGKSFVWNTLSGAVAVLDDNLLAYISSEVTDINHCEELESLRENHFIVPEAFDEYNFVLERADRMMEEAEPENMFLVIAPTLNCNYRCQYCFENQRTSFSSMSQRVIVDTKNFIRKKVDRNCHLKCLQVTWFGGEPLLRLAEIEEMEIFFANLCEKRNIEYRSSLITNGRFLNQHAIDVLLRTHIRKLQISFDGTETTYCQSKQASVEDYRITLSNVKMAAQSGLPILIRINIRNNDFSPAYQLSDLLLGEMELSRMIKIYPAFVNEGPVESRAEMYRRFVDLEHSFAQYIFDHYSADNYFNKLAFAHGIPCSLSCNGNVCIGPNGELYKCEHHFGQMEYVVGNIYQNTAESFENEYYQITKQSLHKEDCRCCPVFPICMGGCPNSMILGEHNFDCNSFISYLTRRQLRNITSHKRKIQ